MMDHNNPDSKVHEANMGPIWGRQDPGGPHVGLMNFAIWDDFFAEHYTSPSNNQMKCQWYQLWPSISK